MSEYKTDRQWSDGYIPAMKQIIGPRLLEESSIEVDQKNATDLIVLNAKNVMIACRLRRYEYMKYKDQFTIRSKRDSGADTELKKIVDGWGDLMFYGFADETEKPAIAAWALIDLKAFRAHLIRNKGGIVMGEKSNGDGTYFAWFKISSFIGDPPLLIDHKY